MSPKKLAIVSTHPIQYYAPVFSALARSEKIQLRVFYTWSQTADGEQFDSGFGVALKWDVPLLAGYEYEFVPNVAEHPGTDSFWGIRNPGLEEAITKWKPDALLVYGWNCHTHLQLMRRLKGHLPIFFRGDSTLLDNTRSWRTLARRAALTWIYRHVDIAIAVGQNNADYFSWCGIKREHIAIAPHSVDVPRFIDNAAAHEQSAQSWRRQLGIDDKTLVILYAGKLIAKKDPGLLLDSFLRLDSKAHLVFIGNGELENELKARAARKENVHFLPFQNQSMMPVVYRLADVFVLPSRGPGETWGLSLNEAMACSRAVIAGSKVGAARDLIQAGHNGWMFKSGNPQSLFDTLKVAIESGQDHLHAMGIEGRNYIRDWSTERCAQRMVEIITAHI